MKSTLESVKQLKKTVSSSKDDIRLLQKMNMLLRRKTGKQETVVRKSFGRLVKSVPMHFVEI